MTDQQSSELAKPGVGSFDDPTALVAVQFTPIFVAPLPIVLLVRCEQLDAAFLQSLAQRVRIIGGVGNHPFRFLSRTAFGSRNRDFLERGFRKRSFVRRAPRRTGLQNPQNCLETRPVRCPGSTPIVPPSPGRGQHGSTSSHCSSVNGRVPVFSGGRYRMLEPDDWKLSSPVLRGLASSNGGRLLGKRIAIDATRLEANAAMRSIVRRDAGESYEEFLGGLAKASGIETPSREDLARLDRKRKKRMSNKEWASPTDGDARITKMKDGRTHLAHKAEHAVDLDTGAVVAVTLHGADLGDTVTLDATLSEAGMAVAELVKHEAAEQRPEATPKVNVEGIEEVVADKGYHSGAVMERVKSYEVRTYIPEKKQAGQRHWEGKSEEQQAVYQNRRRVRGGYGKSLLRRRGELVERSFAHCYETGGMRRTHLRGHENILKRQLVHVGGVQLEPDPAASAGCGHAAAVERPRGDAFFAVYLLLTRRENRNRLSGSRITISCTKSVTESRSSTRSSARLVVPKISYLQPGLLAFVDALEALGCNPVFTGIAEGVVNIGYALDVHMTVNVAVTVNMNVWFELSQLVVQLGRSQDRIQEFLCARNELRHEIDAWQKMRVSDDCVRNQVDFFDIQRGKVIGDLFLSEPLRPSAGTVVHPYRSQRLAWLPEGVVIPCKHRNDSDAAITKRLQRGAARFDHRAHFVEFLQ